VKALAWRPRDSSVAVIDLPRPAIGNAGEVLLKMIQGGLCGTDREIVHSQLGVPPEGAEYLVLGHESLAEVVDCGSKALPVRPGDLVAIRHRRPCSECAQCARGRADLCETGRYRERGIVRLHGFLAEYVVEEAGYLFPLPGELRGIGVLMEPASVLAKVLTRIRLARQALFDTSLSRRVLVLGAGPIGILAAVFASLEGSEVHVASLEPEDSLAARLLRTAGIVYWRAPEFEERGFDCLLDCTGHPAVLFDHLPRLSPNAVVALIGATPHGARSEIDTGTFLLDAMLKNLVFIGMVNADEQSWRRAARDLAAVERRHPGLLGSMLTHRLDWEQAPRALRVREAGEIKAVVELGA
jgi:threonine dehydrogenase-like Zn-dependent dehydrogenase